MKKRPYHSALNKEEDYSNPHYGVLYYPDNSRAFMFDIVRGNMDMFALHYSQADVLYAEVAWKAGLKKFDERAGVSTGYEEYMKALSYIINTQPQPVVIIAGANEGKMLPTPYHVRDIKLNGAKAKAYYYRLYPPVEVASAKELLAMLAQAFDSVGDFCCGYGRSGEIFKSAGKRFILSDYNPKCIGYIKENLR